MSIHSYHVLKSVGLSERYILDWLPRVRSQNHLADSVLLHKGEQPQFWCYVVSGMVGAAMSEGESGCNPISILGEGTWLGEAAILNGQTASFDYVCLSQTRVLCVPASDVRSAFLGQPDFARYLARLTAWRNHQQAELMCLHRTRNLHLRVVMGLAFFAETLLKNSSHLPAHPTDGALEIPLKQGLLASVCGVSRGVFSEAVQQLAALGYLATHYGTLKLYRVKDWLDVSAGYRVRPRGAEYKLADINTKDIMSLMVSLAS